MIAPAKSREIRLGVVMYGGVSLAIYINGVSQELFRAVQGDGIYKLLKLCFDSDIVVDILSGTSAGGINGLMLGYALANDSDFRQTKELWRESGDIERLMYGADSNPDTAKSLLDSDNFYREQLAEAFARLDRNKISLDGCEPSRINEMDVFLTGTAFQPKRSTTFDDAGRPIDMLDFRQVFRLKYRPERENPGPFRPAKADKPSRFQAMAKLSRITSCFPGAFLPVHVVTRADRAAAPPQSLRPSKIFQYEAEVDDLLCSWGKLENSTYFLDGGLLNNKPFTPTIEAIFSQTADRPVTRILFYVEPEPEIVPERGSVADELPTFVSAVRKGVLSISTYQSITDDAKLLEEHNSQVVRHVEVCSKLRGKLGDLSEGVGIPKSLSQPYCELYRGARNNQLVTQMLRGALRDSRTGAEQQMTSAAERAQVKRLFEGLNHERTATELSFDETFRRYDIFFRQRRLHHTVKWLAAEISGNAHGNDIEPWSKSEKEGARQLLAGLNRNVQLLEVVGYWYQNALGKVDIPLAKPDATEDLVAATSAASAQEFKPIFRRVSNSLRSMLAKPAEGEGWLPKSPPQTDLWLNTSELDRVNAEMKRRSQLMVNHDADVPAGDWDGLLQWTDELEEGLIATRVGVSKLAQLAAAEYRQYVSLDAVIFPLDYLSNLQSFDEVRLLRISPAPTLDESGIGCIGFMPTVGAEGKLAGRLLGHFSAFLKRSWRSNDILWGRLDGIRHLVLGIMTGERIQDLRKSPELRLEILNRLQGIGLETLVANIFPQSPPKAHETIAVFFTEMLGSTDFELTSNRLLEIQDLLTQMGQLEAIGEELPSVFEDATQQQNDWNRYGTAGQGKGKTDGGATFISPPGYIDPTLIALKVQNEIQAFKASWSETRAAAASPRTTRLGMYFESEYRIADEGLEKGIPSLILAEYVMRCLLVLNACVLASLPPAARDRISGMGLYKRGVRWPLLAGHHMVRLWRGSPSMAVLSLSALIAASLVALPLVIYLAWMNPSQLIKIVLLGGFCCLLLFCVWLFARRRKFGL